MSKFISREDHKQQQKLHETNRSYGTSGHKYAEKVCGLMQEHNCQSLLDYGCGKDTLRTALVALGVPAHILFAYDPAIPERAWFPPTPIDFITCTDVLEHVEEDYLDSVLADIKARGRYFFFVISGRPAVKNLPDGRNAHITLHNFGWWWSRLEAAGFENILVNCKAQKEEYTFFMRRAAE